MALLDDMLSALCALHQRKIVHGDIKLDNALIYRARDKASAGVFALKARLIDYCDGYIEGDPPTQDNNLPFGITPTYAAPEVLAHDRADRSTETAAALTISQDVYSFAVVCLELLSRHQPLHVAETVSSGAALNVRCDSLEALPELAAVIDGALSTAPATGPTSAEFLTALRIRTAGLPVMRPGLEGGSWRRALTKLLRGGDLPEPVPQLDQARMSSSWEGLEDRPKSRVKTGASAKRASPALIIKGKSSPPRADVALPKIILPGVSHEE